MAHSWSDLKRNRWVEQQTWSTWLVVLLVLVWPMNLFYKFNVSGSYVHGILVDYVLPKIFVSDLVIFALLLLNWKTWVAATLSWVKKNNIHQLLIGLTGVLLLRQFFTPYPIAALWTFAKILEMVFLAVCLSQLFQSKKIYVESVAKSIFASVLFQATVGALQFFTQSSIFPGYAWFGESRLSSYAGIAKASFFGTEKILAYGTTSHPNILAGFCVACGILLWQLEKRSWAKCVFLICIPIIFLTQSLSAALFFFFATAFLLLPLTTYSPQIAARRFLVGLLVAPLLLALISTRVSSTSLSRRVWLNTQAVQMFLTQPIWGTGLDQFTANLNVASSGEAVQFLQPAHHVGILWLAETGLLGGAVLVLILLQLKGRKIPRVLFALFPLVVLDHYLMTNQIGLLIVVFFIVFSQPSPEAKNL